MFGDWCVSLAVIWEFMFGSHSGGEYGDWGGVFDDWLVV